MSWGAVASAGAGLVGGALGGGGGGETVRPMDAIPDFLKDDYKMLASSIAGMPVPEYYQGQQIAGMNPWMSGALGNMGGWGAGTGGDMMGIMYGGGQAGLDAVNQGMGYLNQLQSQGPNQFQFDQGAFDSVMGNLMPGMQGQFDMGARDIQRNFDWNQLPGLNMQNTNFGLQGSTKMGQQTALGQAMADQQKADFGQNLYANALNQATSAGMSAGFNNLGAANSMQGNLIGAYGNFGQLGAGMMNDAYNMGLGNMGQMLQAGQLQQGYDQSLIDADMAKWAYEQNIPMQHLQQQLSMMSSPGGYAPGAPGMTPAEGAVQGMQAGLGIYGAGQNAGWWGQPTSNTDYMNDIVGHDMDVDWANLWG